MKQRAGRAGRDKDVARSEKAIRDSRELTPVESGALVLRTSRGHAWLEAEAGEVHARLPRWATVVAGDLVTTDPQLRVNGLVPRRSLLRRQAGTKGEQVLAANLDQVVIVVGPKLLLREGFLCRAMCGALSEKLATLVVFNKADLDDDGAMRMRAMLYRDVLRFDVLVTSVKKREGLDELKARLEGKCSALVGQSGVGKSSLVNAMFGTDLRIGDVDEWGRGKHTTTLARALRLDPATVLIDLPGVREFGLAELDAATIAAAFPEIAEVARRCKFPDCRHVDAAPEDHCAVIAALEDDALDEERVEAYRAIVLSYAAGDEGGGRT